MEPSGIVWIGKRDIDVANLRGCLSAAYTVTAGVSEIPVAQLCGGAADDRLGFPERCGLDVLIAFLQQRATRLQIVWYDEVWAHICSRELCFEPNDSSLNPWPLLTLLGDKVAFRRRVANFLPLIEGTIFPRALVSYSSARFRYPEASAFVIHGATSSACANIRLIGGPSDDALLSDIVGDDFIVTPLASGIPFNMHIFVGVDDICLAPPSLQLVTTGAGGRIIYRGCDFSAATLISSDEREHMNSFARTIGMWLRSEGYTGVAGLDFLQHRTSIVLVEINARFQASTCVLNSILLAHDMPTAQEIHVMARRSRTLPNLSKITGQGSLLLELPPNSRYLSREPIQAEAMRFPFAGAVEDRRWRFFQGMVAVTPFSTFSQVASENLRL